jgi:hypothetical protein
MFNLYKVSLKTGKRTIVLDLYSRSVTDVMSFCQNNLYAEVAKVYRVEYEAPKSKTYPIDDTARYKNTAKFNVRSNDYAAMILTLQTVKPTRSYDEVFNDMKLLLGTSPTTGIDAYTSIMESSK